MGNSLGGKKSTKVMKIDGETLKLKAPVKAGEVLKEHPGLVLLESEAVKHYGIRAKPLAEEQELQPKRLYFLVELPKEKAAAGPRRVRSGINMSARDRLESLALSRRSASDLTIMKQTEVGPTLRREEDNGGGRVLRRLKLRVPKAEMEKVMKGSKDDAEAAEKIMRFCMAANSSSGIRRSGEIVEEENIGGGGGDKVQVMLDHHVHWKVDRSRVGDITTKAREKRVSFMPIIEGRSPLAVAS